MTDWFQISQTIYYSGAGAVLFGTGVRFVYRFIYQFFNDRRENNAFIAEMRNVHLKNIYNALDLISTELNIRLPLNNPRQ